MDGDSLLDQLKGWLTLVVELVSLLAFPKLVDTTNLFASKVLSTLLCVLGLVVFCLEHGGSEKMGKFHSNNPLSKELRLWLFCKNFASMEHIVLLGMAPLKRINLLLGLLILGRDCERHVDRGPFGWVHFATRFQVRQFVGWAGKVLQSNHVCFEINISQISFDSIVTFWFLDHLPISFQICESHYVVHVYVNWSKVLILAKYLEG